MADFCEEDLSIKAYRALSQGEVEGIYREKINLLNKIPISNGLSNKDREERALGGMSVMVAEKFKTSPKTVRDIWSRRTWPLVTCRFWYEETDPDNPPTPEELRNLMLQHAPRRPSGRPKGSKDSQPRFRSSQTTALLRPENPNFSELSSAMRDSSAYRLGSSLDEKRDSFATAAHASASAQALAASLSSSWPSSMHMEPRPAALQHPWKNRSLEPCFQVNTSRYHLETVALKATEPTYERNDSISQSDARQNSMRSSHVHFGFGQGLDYSNAICQRMSRNGECDHSAVARDSDKYTFGSIGQLERVMQRGSPESSPNQIFYRQQECSFPHQTMWPSQHDSQFQPRREILQHDPALGSFVGLGRLGLSGSLLGAHQQTQQHYAQLLPPRNHFVLQQSQEGQHQQHGHLWQVQQRNMLIDSQRHHSSELYQEVTTMSCDQETAIVTVTAQADLDIRSSNHIYRLQDQVEKAQEKEQEKHYHSHHIESSTKVMTQTFSGTNTSQGHSNSWREPGEPDGEALNYGMANYSSVSNHERTDSTVVDFLWHVACTEQRQRET